MGEGSTAESIHGHPGVVEDTLNPVRREEKEVLKCLRCGSAVPRDDPEKLAEMDCDHYKEVGEGIAGSINGGGTNGG